jgi:hypothetical protein
LGVGQVTQGGVPVGFEGVGDQPAGRVDGEVASPGGVGVVLGALDVCGADRVGVLGVGGQSLQQGGSFTGRAGPAVRSLPWAAALASRVAWLVSYWAQVM